MKLNNRIHSKYIMKMGTIQLRVLRFHFILNCVYF